MSLWPGVMWGLCFIVKMKGRMPVYYVIISFELENVTPDYRVLN